MLIRKLPYITFPEGSEEHKYLHTNAVRRAVTWLACQAVSRTTEKLEPPTEDFGALLEEYKVKRFPLRSLSQCPERDAEEQVDQRLPVPIIADEARTFGGAKVCSVRLVFSPNGQQAHTPQDREQVAYYKEDEKGQTAGRYQRAGRSRRISLAAAPLTAPTIRR